MSLDHSIQWRNFHSDITSAIKILRDDEDFVDVTLACEGNQVKAHKMVLSACSPYFKSLLKTNPCQHPIVFLKDVKLANLISILNFMYHGEVDILQNEVATFLETAKALEVRGLSEYGTRKESSKHLEDHSSGPTIIDHTPPKRQGLEPSTPANDGSVHLTKSPIPHKKRRLSITTLSEGDKEASQFATREEESAVVKDETLDIDMEDYQSLLTDCINSVHVQTGILIKEDVGRKNSNQLSCSDIASTPFAHSSPQAGAVEMSNPEKLGDATLDCSENIEESLIMTTPSKRKPRECTICSKQVLYMAQHLRSHGLTPDECVYKSYETRRRRKPAGANGRKCPLRGCEKQAPHSRLDLHLRRKHGLSPNDDVYQSLCRVRGHPTIETDYWQAFAEAVIEEPKSSETSDVMYLQPPPPGSLEDLIHYDFRASESTAILPEDSMKQETSCINGELSQDDYAAMASEQCYSWVTLGGGRGRRAFSIEERGIISSAFKEQLSSLHLPSLPCIRECIKSNQALRDIVETKQFKPSQIKGCLLNIINKAKKII